MALSDDQVAQLRRDMGFLRDQILTRLGVADPEDFPPGVGASLLDELTARIMEAIIQAPRLSDADIQRLADAITSRDAQDIATAVADEVARRVAE